MEQGREGKKVMGGVGKQKRVVKVGSVRVFGRLNSSKV